MSHLWRYLCLCSFLAAAHSPLQLSAQSIPAQGTTLSGTVTDPSGAKVQRATVHIQTHADTSAASALPPAFQQDTTTDASGIYTAAVPPGTYDITILATGFDAFFRTLTLSAKPAHLDARMAIATHAEEVDVPSDNNASTAAADNKSALIFKGDQLDMFSKNETTFQQEIQSMAGGPDGAQILVDGFSGGSFPPRDSIREIRINQNPFSTQYDSLGFGRFEIFTKPGSDKLHGYLFIGGTDNIFNAQNPYAASPPPYHEVDYRASLDGPLGKKTSFFLNVNRRDGQDTAVVNATTLDSTTFQPVNLSQTVYSPQTSTETNLRIDRQLNANNTLVARYDVAISHQSNSGVGLLVLPTEGTTNQTQTQTLQLGNTQLIGAKIVSETRFQYIRGRTQQAANSSAPSLVVQGAFNGGGAPGQNQRDNQDSYEFQQYLSLALGKHFVRAGARYRTARDANLSTANYNGQYIFSGNTAPQGATPYPVSPLSSTSLLSYQITQQGLAAGLAPGQTPAQLDAQIRSTCRTTTPAPGTTDAAQVACGGASQFSLTAGQAVARLVSGDLGLYAEDEWKVTKTITLDYGLRFETQSAVPDHFDPAPRAGAAWAIGKTDKHAPLVTLRGGAGFFYTRFAPGNLLTSVRQNGTTQQSYFITNPASYPSVPSTASLTGTPPTPYTVSPNLRSGYAFISGLTAERSIGKIGNLSVNYLGTRGVHLYNSYNINAPQPGTGVRPLGGTGNVYQFASDGLEHAQQLFINANLHPGKYFMFLNYNARHESADTFGAGNFPSQPYNLRADFGPGQAGRSSRQRLFAGGGGPLPFGFDAFIFLSAQTGSHIDVTTGTDLNGDSIYNDRPAFATDLSRPSVVRTRYGNFDTAPIAGQTLVPAGFIRSPGLLYTEMSLGREFKFGPRPAAPPPPPDAPTPKGPLPKPDPRYSLNVSVEADNALNTVNPSAPVGVLSSPYFGRSLSLNTFFNNRAAANRVLFFYTNFRF